MGGLTAPTLLAVLGLAAVAWAHHNVWYDPPVCPPTGTLLYNHNKCKLYYECRDGHLTTHACPMLQRFDRQRLRCGFIWNVKCHDATGKRRMDTPLPQTTKTTYTTKLPGSTIPQTTTPGPILSSSISTISWNTTTTTTHKSYTLSPTKHHASTSLPETTTAATTTTDHKHTTAYNAHTPSSKTTNNNSTSTHKPHLASRRTTVNKTTKQKSHTLPPKPRHAHGHKTSKTTDPVPTTTHNNHEQTSTTNIPISTHSTHKPHHTSRATPVDKTTKPESHTLPPTSKHTPGNVPTSKTTDTVRTTSHHETSPKHEHTTLPTTTTQLDRPTKDANHTLCTTPATKTTKGKTQPPPPSTHPQTSTSHTETTTVLTTIIHHKTTAFSTPSKTPDSTTAPSSTSSTTPGSSTVPSSTSKTTGSSTVPSSTSSKTSDSTTAPSSTPSKTPGSSTASSSTSKTPGSSTAPSSTPSMENRDHTPSEKTTHITSSTHKPYPTSTPLTATQTTKHKSYTLPPTSKHTHGNTATSKTTVPVRSTTHHQNTHKHDHTTSAATTTKPELTTNYLHPTSNKTTTKTTTGKSQPPSSTSTHSQTSTSHTTTTSWTTTKHTTTHNHHHASSVTTSSTAYNRTTASYVSTSTQHPVRHLKCPVTGCQQFPHSSCWKYYDCKDGSLAVKECWPLQYFDRVRRSCDWRWKVDCHAQPKLGTLKPAAPTTPSWGYAPPSCPSAGSRQFPHNDCWKYYDCHDGDLVVQQCLPFERFSRLTLQCEAQWKVDCDVLPRNASLAPGRRLSPPTPTCPRSGTREVADEADCSRYYVCQDGVPARRSCGFLRRYSRSEQTCVPVWSGVDCDSRPSQIYFF